MTIEHIPHYSLCKCPMLRHGAWTEHWPKTVCSCKFGSKPVPKVLRHQVLISQLSMLGWLYTPGSGGTAGHPQLPYSPATTAIVPPHQAMPRARRRSHKHCLCPHQLPGHCTVVPARLQRRKLYHAPGYGYPLLCSQGHSVSWTQILASILCGLIAKMVWVTS